MFKRAPTDPEAKLGFCEGQGLWGWVEGLHNFTSWACEILILPKRRAARRSWR